MLPLLKNEWGTRLKKEYSKPYFQQLREFIVEEYKNHAIFPEQKDIFNALQYTDYRDVKAVILGQDPYHGKGQAHGLSFSVKPGVAIPPSLKNIYKELHEDMNCYIPDNGYLVKWAEQGVLLLNTVLTVRQGEANSHKGKGWEPFTDQIIKQLDNREDPVIFVLWGRHAQAKKDLIVSSHHHILESPHPSPFSARHGFFGSHHFSKINALLRNQGKQEIDWQIENLTYKI